MYKIEDEKKYALFSNQGDTISLDYQQNLWTTDTLYLYHREVSTEDDDPPVVKETLQKTSYSSSNYIVFKLKNGQLGWAELGYLDSSRSMDPTIIKYKLSVDNAITIGI